jgi:alpha-L-fucosidase
MAQYDATSPYFETTYSQFFLDTMVNRPIPKENDDLTLVINTTYQYRPDLLAFDLYGIAGLWWVFYQRNPNTLQAPPLDFKAGTLIYLPKITTLKSALGF